MCTDRIEGAKRSDGRREEDQRLHGHHQAHTGRRAVSFAMAPQPSRRPLPLRTKDVDDSAVTQEKDEDYSSTASSDAQTHTSSRRPSSAPAQPILAHRFRNDSSILCLVASDTHIIAGNQRGQILVYALGAFELARTVDGAHRGSVLGLCLSADGSKLFSSGSDRLVCVWNARSFARDAVFYSHYDLGDVFCVSYAERSRVLFLGCQNTSLLWCRLDSPLGQDDEASSAPPQFVQDRFFDSLGPGGVKHPRQDAQGRVPITGARAVIQIPPLNVHEFAHYGYVYCMLMTSGAKVSVNADEVLVTGGGDGAICLWAVDAADGGRPQHIARLEDERDDMESILSILLDGTLLFSGRTGGEVHVWDLEARQLVRVLNNTDADILSLSVGSQSLFCVAASGEALQYNQRYDCVGSWKAHHGRALASAYMKTRSRAALLTGGSDDSVAIWDVDMKSPTATHHPAEPEDQFVSSLRQFVSYRTVSCDPRYSTSCRRGASWLRSLFKSLGAATELLNTDDGCNPIVLAKFRGDVVPAQQRNRVLFYGHYDVIAAEDKQRSWVCDPFTMTGLDGYFYGRGVTDNKGPIMAALYAVSDLMKSRKLASDVVFVIEGEEECGSRRFKETIRRHKNLIGPIDWILLANSYWLDDEVPCLTYGLRGVIHATVEIESEQPDLHSGVDGSRLLDEPLKDLVNLLAKLNGPKGLIDVPGFYDAILPVTKSERALYDEISKSLLARDPSLGSPQALTASLMQRWRDASLTFHGFKTSGSEKSTIIPRFASAALSIRLVPNQESSAISAALEQHLKACFKELHSKNALKVCINHQAEPWLGDPSNRLFKSLRQAIADVWSSHRRRGSSSKPPMSPTQSAVRPAARRLSASNGRPPAPATSSTLASSSNAAAAAVAVAANQSPSPEFAALDSAVDASGPMSPLSSAVPARPLTSSIENSRPLFIREGGSIPAIRFLELEFGAPAANLPCGQASDNAHLDNERLRVANLLNAREIFRRVFLDLMA